MPELPEVETVASQLRAVILGKRLKAIRVLDRKLSIRSRTLQPTLEVREVFRAGKKVIVRLTGKGKKQSLFIAVHLRMTGQLVWNNGRESTLAAGAYYRKLGTSAPKSLRAKFYFNDGEVDFLDTRRFGTVEMHSDEKLLATAGLDPLSEGFTFEVFERLLSGKQALKHWLMRQDRITGIGNIYASEILFRSRLSPKRMTNRLNRSEKKRLYEAIVTVLKQAIERSGTTFKDFRDVAGATGGFQELLRVYDRDGLPCLDCKTVVKRIVQQQRSTYYCPKCQASSVRV